MKRLQKLFGFLLSAVFIFCTASTAAHAAAPDPLIYINAKADQSAYRFYDTVRLHVDVLNLDHRVRKDVRVIIRSDDYSIPDKGSNTALLGTLNANEISSAEFSLVRSEKSGALPFMQRIILFIRNVFRRSVRIPTVDLNGQRYVRQIRTIPQNDGQTEVEIYVVCAEDDAFAGSTDDTLKITFVGDCMFASDHGSAKPGSFNLLAQEKPADYFLQNFIPLFSADDFTIANCECVLSDHELQEKPSSGPRSFWFKGPARHAEIFRAADVQFASVVNNHSHDFGQQGSDDTEAALESVGVLPGRRDMVTYTTVKGQKLGIFCYELARNDGIADVLEKVREMQQAECDLIILYFHSGVEYATAPEKRQVRAFRALIDAGVDVIVSTHPHVIQPMEVYRGKPILYSLGNFCFGGNTHPPRDTIVYQAVYQLKEGRITDRQDVIIPCATYTGEVNNYQPDIVTDKDKQQEILQFMQTPIEA